jgi:hypothetical protein
MTSRGSVAIVTGLLLLVERRSTMEKKVQRKPFRQPATKDQTTDLTLLKEMNKELGIKEVEPPDTVTVFFPMSDEVVD